VSREGVCAAPNNQFWKCKRSCDARFLRSGLCGCPLRDSAANLFGRGCEEQQRSSLLSVAKSIRRGEMSDKSKSIPGSEGGATAPRIPAATTRDVVKSVRVQGSAKRLPDDRPPPTDYTIDFTAPNNHTQLVGGQPGVPLRLQGSFEETPATEGDRFIVKLDFGSNLPVQDPSVTQDAGAGNFDWWQLTPAGGPLKARAHLYPASSNKLLASAEIKSRCQFKARFLCDIVSTVGFVISCVTFRRRTSRIRAFFRDRVWR